MMNFQFLVLTGFVIANCFVSGDAVSQSKSISLAPKQEEAVKPADIEAARMELQRAASYFSKLARLAKRGSVSSFDLKEAEFDKQLAELQFQSLQDPSMVAGNLVLIAKLKVELEESKFEISQRLFKSRSLSELKYRRQRYKLKSARIALRSATGEISKEAANLLVARDQVELAKIELELGRKLRRHRSITQSTYQELLQRLQASQRKVLELERLQQAKRDAIKQKTRT